MVTCPDQFVIFGSVIKLSECHVAPSILISSYHRILLQILYCAFFRYLYIFKKNKTKLSITRLLLLNLALSSVIVRRGSNSVLSLWGLEKRVHEGSANGRSGEAFSRFFGNSFSTPHWQSIQNLKLPLSAKHTICYAVISWRFSSLGKSCIHEILRRTKQQHLQWNFRNMFIQKGWIL